MRDMGDEGDTNCSIYRPPARAGSDYDGVEFDKPLADL